ncbi:hypothetical protein [Sphingobium nicotianae]|uniref:Uncharacterized protein n=1 Tax=Sphingobium nicotianae TaxID=2782607 RepID=A0A9X1DDH0_9SPHN|nr:hypothetical protein [Sphingobium nicotianae]MBT2187912.1 hypothetical protein [Sphingobium nicotianae]
MSRSRRKTPIFGNASAPSEAAWKAKAARKLRHNVRQVLATTLDGDRFAGKRWDGVNPYDGPKDGKHWFGKADARWLRK